MSTMFKSRVELLQFKVLMKRYLVVYQKLAVKQLLTFIAIKLAFKLKQLFMQLLEVEFKLTLPF